MVAQGGGGWIWHSHGTTRRNRGRAFNPRVVKRLLEYLRPHRFSVILAMVLVCVTAAMHLIGPYLLKVAIDDYLVERQDVAGLSMVCIGFLLTLLIAWGSQAGESYTMSAVTQRVLKHVRDELFTKINRLPLRYHDRHKSGVTMSRIINDVTVLQELLTHGFVDLVADLLVIVGIVVIMLSMSPKLALYTFALLPLMVIVTLFFAHRVRGAYLQARETIAQVAASLQENISGVRVVQAFARERVSQDQFDQVNLANLQANLWAVTLSSAFPPVVEIIAMLATATVLWFGAQSVLAGEITVGVVVAFLTYVSRFFQPIRELSTIYTLFQQSMAAGEKIFELMDTPVEVDDRPNARTMPRIEGKVEFDHVNFSYRQGVPVLKDICFTVEPGQTIALVGPTGAGKTSISSLISRFYDVSEGRVLIDGVDVRDVTQSSLRGQIGVVPQDPFLFAGTLADNIRFGRLDASEEELMEAAKQANAHDFIARMPEGYATQVFERGQNFSQGQRQLIALARVVLADPRILVLDEATASIDTRTESLIQAALKRLLSGRTSFVIAHRLSTIRNADGLLVIHQGQVVQRGTHDELVEKEGVYRDLYQMQFRHGSREQLAGPKLSLPGPTRMD
ncbi:MAG: ATP-binding cassette domain-containing protein [Deltaproteobacteria bacterium]|nr:ATP-binding cassette domain-containing protein [Deltaproteobacteria bacterium]